jgi:hypothetical protein
VKKLFIAVIILAVCMCTQNEETQIEPKDVIDLLPLDSEISGWTRSSATEIAENESQLWALIDGEGQVYIDNGFVKCAFQTYNGDISGPVDLRLRIWDMGTTAHAEAIYDELANGTEIPWTSNNAGTEARYELLTGIVVDYYELEFWEDDFFVWMQIDNDTQAALDVAQLFALNISAAISDTTESE